ncbi:MAG TPA: YCF48-related protein [Alphaproteobacteria bacterium]|nr:YCF48-related protein [Alphaproteobacteria bacterium]
MRRLALAAMTAGLAAAAPLGAGGAWAAAGDGPAEIAPLAAKSLLLDSVVIGNRLLAVGERGHVTYSDDGGASWSQGRVPTRVTLTAVTFVDDRTGWAVGHDGVVLKTEDAGATWALQRRNSEGGAPLLDVRFFDARTGIAVGAYGVVLSTADGGANWTEGRIGEDDFHLNTVLPLADGRLLVAGEAGSLYVSADRGANFDMVDSPYEGSFFGALQAADGGILAFGLRGHVFRSEDGGETWQEVKTGVTASLLGGAVRADGTVVLAGLAGTVLTSRDGGRSFQTTVLPGRVGFANVIEAGGKLILFGEQGARPVEAGELAQQTSQLQTK